MIRRGRAEMIADDQKRTEGVREHTIRTGEPAGRVWCPPRQVVFGPRDVRRDGYELAREAADSRGFTPTTREVGGRAVAFTGETVALVLASPVTGVRQGIQDRYDRAAATLQDVLGDLGVEARTGEPEAAFCPGSHSLQAGGKLVGFAQRVRNDIAVLAGVVVTDRPPFVTVLEPVYERLGLPFDPEAVGSVAAAGGPGDPAVVADAIAEALTVD